VLVVGDCMVCYGYNILEIVEWWDVFFWGIIWLVRDIMIVVL
jgi:hypothetical protein